MFESVLVLNANFEPLHVCDLHRAIGMVICDKASLVMNGRGVFHSANSIFPIPSVIRLQQMVRAPRPHVPLNRREIFRRDFYTCQYCGKTTQLLTIDHVIPRHLGGKHEWTNVVAACASCNHQKGGRLLSETSVKLQRPPKKPSNAANYVFARYLTSNSDWVEFLNGW